MTEAGARSYVRWRQSSRAIQTNSGESIIMAIAVFRSYVNPSHLAVNNRLYAEMHELVQRSPGYLAHKLFEAADGETVVVAEFETVDDVETWGANPDHKLAQEAGKDHVYLSYDVAVCEVVERHIKRPADHQ